MLMTAETSSLLMKNGKWIGEISASELKFNLIQVTDQYADDILLYLFTSHTINQIQTSIASSLHFKKKW